MKSGSEKIYQTMRYGDTVTVYKDDELRIAATT